MSGLRIGELSKRAGCTVKAVRFYEASGLLPRAARSPAGYRLYSEHDLKRLAFIQRAKLMGLPLGKIKDLVVHLSETKCACPEIRPHLEQLIREQLRDIVTKTGQLALLRKDREGFLAKMGRAKPALPAELWRAPGRGRGRPAMKVLKTHPKRGRR